MIIGPLQNGTSPPPFQSHKTDENNTLTLHCRVTCQENGAYYTPHIRIITTIDGQVHDRRNASLFSTDKSPSDNTCDSANPIRDYEFRITALNDTLNESIATCGLLYQSQTSSTKSCHTSTLVWITLPPPTTAMPPKTRGPITTEFTTEAITTTSILPTTTMPLPTTRGPVTMTVTDITTQTTTTTALPPASPNDETTTEKTDSSTSENSPSMLYLAARTRNIPDEVSILFIVIAALCIVIVLGAGALFLYKKFGNNRKRKLSSVLPLGEDGSTVIQAHGEDGSTVMQSHGGVLKCEDIETVKYRASAQT